MLVDRHGPLVRILTEDGKSDLVTDRLSAFDSMMMNVFDPRNAPEMLTLRESIRDRRFYDHFRTDADAPVRSPQVGTCTPILGSDGADLGAAIQTIREIAAYDALAAAVDDAIPDSCLRVENIEGGSSLELVLSLESDFVRLTSFHRLS